MLFDTHRFHAVRLVLFSLSLCVLSPLANAACADVIDPPGPVTGTLSCDSSSCDNSGSLDPSSNLACTNDCAAGTLALTCADWSGDIVYIGGCSDTHTVTCGSSVSTPDAIIVDTNGVLTFDNGIEQTMSEEANTITVSGGGRLNVLSGALKHTGYFLVEGSGSVVSITAGTVDRFDGKTQTDMEYIDVTSSGRIEVSGSSTSDILEFHNEPSGFRLQSGGAIEVNAATIRAEKLSPILNAGGLMEIHSGRVQPKDGTSTSDYYSYSQTSGELLCDNGDLKFDDLFSITAGTFTVTSGGCTLRLDVNGAMTNGVFDLSGDLTVETSTLTIGGGGLTLRIADGVTLAGTRMAMGSGVTFTPGGNGLGKVTADPFPAGTEDFIVEFDLDPSNPGASDHFDIVSGPSGQRDLMIRYGFVSGMNSNTTFSVMNHPNGWFGLVNVECMSGTGVACDSWDELNVLKPGGDSIELEFLFYPVFDPSTDDDDDDDDSTNTTGGRVDNDDDDEDDEGAGSLVGPLIGVVGGALLLGSALAVSRRSSSSSSSSGRSGSSKKDEEAGTAAAALLSARRGGDNDAKILGAKDSKERLDALNDLVMSSNEFTVVMGEVVPASSREGVARSLISIFESQRQGHTLINTLLKSHLKDVAQSDALRTGAFVSTVIVLYFRLVGESYMRKVIGPIVRDCIKSSNDKSELDPRRASSLTTLQRGQDNISSGSQKLVDRVAKIKVPGPIQDILSLIKAALAKKGWSKRSDVVLPQLLLNRFILPALAQPKSYGLVSKPPNVNATRSLVLISKTVSSLLSGKKLGGKEDFMKSMEELRAGNKKTIDRWSKNLGTTNAPTPGQAGSNPAVTDLTLQRAALLALMDYALNAGAELDTRLHGSTGQQWKKLKGGDAKKWHRQTMTSVASLTSYLSEDDTWSVGPDLDSLEFDFAGMYGPSSGRGSPTKTSPKKARTSPTKGRTSPVKKRRPSQTRPKK